METVRAFLNERAVGDLVCWQHQQEAAARFGLSVAEVEGAILETGLLPGRYQRNRQMLTTQQQLRLFRSRVAVVGCGGLGGYILEQLARLGVGQLVAIDPDVFEEHNLNRQILSSPASLGRAKVEVAAERIAEINPAVTLVPVRQLLSAENAGELLASAGCVADGVDNVKSRLELEKSCDRLDIPLVHGAIAGWYGHVATAWPGEWTIQKIYSHWTGGKGIEQQLGNPAFTPALAASFEVAEICKILLGQGRQLRNRKLAFNLLDMEIEEVPL